MRITRHLETRFREAATETEESLRRSFFLLFLPPSSQRRAWQHRSSRRHKRQPPFPRQQRSSDPPMSPVQRWRRRQRPAGAKRGSWPGPRHARPRLSALVSDRSSRWLGVEGGRSSKILPSDGQIVECRTYSFARPPGNAVDCKHLEHFVGFYYEDASDHYMKHKYET